MLEEGDLKDHCRLSLGLNIGLFITLNRFTGPNVNRNVCLIPFLNQISTEVPSPPSDPQQSPVQWVEWDEDGMRMG